MRLQQQVMSAPSFTASHRQILSCAAKRTMKNMNYTKLMLGRMGYILITIYYWTRIPCIHGTITLSRRRKVRERKIAFNMMKHNSLNNVSTTSRHYALQTRIHYFWRENFQKKNGVLARENYFTTENMTYVFFIQRNLLNSADILESLF